MMDRLRSRADHPQHLFAGREVVLLDRTQSLRRCGVACQDHEVTAQLEQFKDTGFRKLVDLFKRPGAIGYTCIDRKSTRLNSSHVKISYAVFCLKKKNNKSIYKHQLQNS